MKINIAEMFSSSFWLLSIWLVIYCAVLMWLRRAKTEAFKFCFGAVGLFLLLFFLTGPYLAYILQNIICFLMDLVAPESVLSANITYGSLLVHCGNDDISMIVDYECCGMIEILAITCIMHFYPLYKFSQKLILTTIAIICTIFANIVRLFSIALIIHYFGTSSYYIAHSFVGRLVFWVITIVIYYYLLTYPHLHRQKVEVFKYGD